MNRSADYRTLEDKLYDIYMNDGASEGEKFNAGALYFKRTGKLIQMHQRTPDPNVRPTYSAASVEDIMRRWSAAQSARSYAQRARARSNASARRRRTTARQTNRDYSERGWYRNAAGQWIDLDGRAHDAYGRYTRPIG